MKKKKFAQSKCPPFPLPKFLALGSTNRRGKYPCHEHALFGRLGLESDVGRPAPRGPLEPSQASGF